MTRVPEPDPPEVRSRPTWPTPLGRCRAMQPSAARCKLWTRLLARWLELEDAEDTNALLAMPGVHWCLRLCCAVAAARAIGATSRAAVAHHGLNDLSRGEDLPYMQQAKFKTVRGARATRGQTHCRPDRMRMPYSVLTLRSSGDAACKERRVSCIAAFHRTAAGAPAAPSSSHHNDDKYDDGYDEADATADGVLLEEVEWVE